MTTTKRTVEIAVVGVGGWGKNLARNYYQIPDANLRYVCDLDENRLGAIQAQFPAERTTQEFDDLLKDDELEAVVIATTGPTHYSLCKAVLEAGKDVYVEKPFVLEASQAQSLIELAASKDRLIMVGHLMIYHPVMRALKDLVQQKTLGDLYYLYSQRLNLGTIREDENALWNFAPHDISSMVYLVGQEPLEVSARGQSYLQKGIEDVVFLSMSFPGDVLANVQVSWLDPHKIRKLTLVGSDQMAVFDDLEPNEKLRIYDKGATVNSDYDNFAEYIGLRFGDIHIPHINAGEPLRVECSHFLDCVRERRQPDSNGDDGLAVVKVLEAAQKSLKQGGVPVSLANNK